MPDVNDDVSLAVDGVDYSGWQDVNVTFSIETIANSFDLKLTDRTNDFTTSFFDGDACSVKLGGETVITGFIDNFEPSLSPDQHDIRATGRDATGDLVDCSAVHNPGEWRGRTALQIVTALCAPFGIAVTTQADIGRSFASFKLQEGETAFEAIDRLCKARALLPISDGRGGLVLMRSGSNAPRIDAGLEEGLNIKRCSGFFSMLDRYSEIIVKGQQPQLDGMTADQASGPSARATDPTVKRYRPFIIIAEDENDGLTLEDRATWEASVRAGRSRRAEVTVAGWRNRAGQLWRPNTIVPVHAPTIGVSQDMLITTAALHRGEDGSETTLSLAHPKSFDLVAVTETKTNSGTSNDALIGTPKYVGSELVKGGQ